MARAVRTFSPIRPGLNRVLLSGRSRGSSALPAHLSPRKPRGRDQDVADKCPRTSANVYARQPGKQGATPPTPKNLVDAPSDSAPRPPLAPHDPRRRHRHRAAYSQLDRHVSRRGIRHRQRLLCPCPRSPGEPVPHDDTTSGATLARRDPFLYPHRGRFSDKREGTGEEALALSTLASSFRGHYIWRSLPTNSHSDSAPRHSSSSFSSSPRACSPAKSPRVPLICS